jgi:hypothetical protein
LLIPASRNTDHTSFVSEELLYKKVFLFSVRIWNISYSGHKIENSNVEHVGKSARS